MDGLITGKILWISVVAGLIATTGMELLFRKITKSGLANADMVRAIGSVFTKSMETAYRVGIIIHFISGIIFAFIYTLVISFLNIHGFISCVGSGLLMGFIHGAVVGFVLVVLVSEHHPLAEFRNAGFLVAVAHWGGHLLYGVIIGAVVGIMQ